MNIKVRQSKVEYGHRDRLAGSNAARYAYLVLFILRTVGFLSSSMAVTGLELILSFVGNY